MKKRLIASVTCLCLLLVMFLSSTLAWFTDQTEVVHSSMTVGQISIEQLVYTEEGKNIMPDVPFIHTVTVKNDGTEPAYLRTLFAFEDGTYTDKNGAEQNVLAQIALNEGNQIVIPGVTDLTLPKMQILVAKDGKTALYTVGYYIHPQALEANTDTLVVPMTSFTLAQEADETWYQAVGGFYDILVLSQACQQAGFENVDPSSALNTTFGDLNGANTANWFGGEEYMDVSWYNDVATEFELTNVAQLVGLAHLVNTGVDSFAGKTVKLANDVDLSIRQWIPIGTSSATPFAGAFDGQGFIISNLNVSSEAGFAGLFGYVKGEAVLSNFELQNVSVKSVGYTGAEGSNAGYYAGAVVAYSNGAVTISNVKVTGDIEIYAEAMYAGGIIGRAKGSAITNCSVIGNDGSSIVSNRWAAGVSGYDNGAHKVSGCFVENIMFETKSYAGAIAGLGAVGANISGNTIKDVEIVLNEAEEENTLTYGTVIGGTAVYSYSKGPVTVSGNVCENVTCIVNETVAVNQEIGSKYADGTDQGLVMTTTIKYGDSYYTYLKLAFAAVPKDGQPVVIELTGDTMITAKYKPSVAKDQNIVLKTNGFNLIWVEQDANKMPVYNADGTLSTVIVTAENYTSYISVNSSGSLVIE